MRNEAAILTKDDIVGALQTVVDRTLDQVVEQNVMTHREQVSIVVIDRLVVSQHPIVDRIVEIGARPMGSRQWRFTAPIDDHDDILTGGDQPQLLLLPLLAAASQVSDGKRILVVNTYHLGFAGSNPVTQVIESVLEGTGVDLRTIYLDSK
jgi:hypothetical protein